MKIADIKKTEFTKQDIVFLLKLREEEDLDALYEHADLVRKNHVGSEVQVRAILEFSNHCCRNCLYCGIRQSNNKIARYRMESDEIIENARKADKMGFKTIILQSGEDFYYTVDKLQHIIKNIKNSTDLIITLSIGEREEVDYRALKEAGADRFLLKHETSDPILYRALHPDLKYSNRIKCLRELKSLGFETGSGIMVGLPGQTLESIANDILLFKTLDIDMIGIGPYLPHPDTPLAARFEANGGYFMPSTGTFNPEEMIYKIIAITRIVTRKAHIPATTGFNTLNSNNVRGSALHRGANVIMLNVGDSEYRELYEIYPAKKQLAAENAETLEDLRKRLPEFKFV
jgi:biotin synthase